MILHLSHIFLTDGLTFIIVSLIRFGGKATETALTLSSPQRRAHAQLNRACKPTHSRFYAVFASAAGPSRTGAAFDERRFALSSGRHKLPFINTQQRIPITWSGD